MEQGTLTDVIKDQTIRALWEVKNVTDCVPDRYWNREYCDMPVWKHIYHMLHSMDLWFINPRDPQFAEPEFHEKDLNNLDVVSSKALTRAEINSYMEKTEDKIRKYLDELSDEALSEKPESCEYTKFTLILAQYRHLHTHMGMIMGFIIEGTGLWPRIIGLEGEIPAGDYEKYL